jgi:hypothetical protein
MTPSRRHGSATRRSSTKPSERTRYARSCGDLTIKDPDVAERALYEELIPRVSGAPGFISGYWTTKDDTALSMFIFETEEAATRMSEQARSGVPGGVVLDGIEVREVVEHA